MVSTMTVRWFHLLDDLYNLDLPSGKRERWSNMFNQNFPGITEEKLIEAIRWSSDNWQRESRYKPDFAEVSNMVKAFLDQARGSSPERYAPKCELCFSGWLSGVTVPGVIPAPYTAAIPCRCSEGQRILDREYPRHKCPRTRAALEEAAKNHVNDIAAEPEGATMTREEFSKAVRGLQTTWRY